MTDMSEDEALFWLGTAPGIGAVKAGRLIGKVKDAVSLYHLTRDELTGLSVLKEKDVDVLLAEERRERAKKAYEHLAGRGIRYISRYSREYPKRLTHIGQAPLQLYVKGRMPDASGLSVAIVGARECTCYGRDMARMFAFRLARAGVQIVSGMARGVDGWAHQGALEAGGATFAVLGCGVDVCYPQKHAGLYRSIVRHGGVISEYRPGVRARPAFFPQRNRIISGLSDGVLIVEAERRSGSLITVDSALEQGRDVFVIPGRIGDALSEGCNRLIVQGATPVLSPDDILDYYGMTGEGEDDAGKKDDWELGALEERIYVRLKRAAAYTDVLCGELGESATDVMKAVLKLRKKGKVREVSRGYFEVSG